MVYAEIDINLSEGEQFYWVAYAESANSFHEEEYFVWEDGGGFEDFFEEAAELGIAAQPHWQRTGQFSLRGDNLLFHGRFGVSDYPKLAGRDIEEANVDIVGGTSVDAVNRYVKEELDEGVYDRIQEARTLAAGQ